MAHLDVYNEKLSYQKEIYPVVNTNTLAFTYELYGSLEKEEDIIKANSVDNPGFLNESEALRVVV